jgi:hypothetical protein
MTTLIKMLLGFTLASTCCAYAQNQATVKCITGPTEDFYLNLHSETIFGRMHCVIGIGADAIEYCAPNGGWGLISFRWERLEAASMTREIVENYVGFIVSAELTTETFKFSIQNGPLRSGDSSAVNPYDILLEVDRSTGGGILQSAGEKINVMCKRQLTKF